MITAQNNMFSRGGGKYRSLLIAAAILCGAFAAHATTIDPSNYEHEMSIKPAAGRITSTLSNFPLLVRLSPARQQSFNPSDCGTNGADLRFALADGTLLSHEIDTWSTTGESAVWVNVPSLAADTEIKVYWGVKDSSLAPAVNAADAWPDFVAVYHLGEGNATALDSSGNGYTAVNVKAVTAGASPVVGGCASIHDMFVTTPAVTDLTASSAVKPLADRSCVTFSGWVAVDSFNTDDKTYAQNARVELARKFDVDQRGKGGFSCRYFADNNYGNGSANPLFGIFMDHSGYGATVNWNTTAPQSNGGWLYLTCTVDGTAGAKYINGAAMSDSPTTLGHTILGPDPITLDFGAADDSTDCQTYARMDEVRIRNGTVSADWAAADYAQQTDAAFLVFEENIDETFVVSAIPDQVVESAAELQVGVTPSVTVSNLTTSTELGLGTDYTVAYENNTSAGIATAVVTGINTYEGHTARVGFTIIVMTPYYIVGGNTAEGANSSTISGAGGSTGWSTTRGGTKSAAGITAEKAIYYVWTDRWNRTPTADFHTPQSSKIVVDSGCTWELADKMMDKTLALNNLSVGTGGILKISPANDGNGVFNNTLSGSCDLAEGATLQLSASKDANSAKQYTLNATVTGRGAILMPSTSTANAYSGTLANKIAGDITGFTGDIETWNGYNAVSLELVNAVSLPGDPLPSETAYVIVTNSATLKIDNDWVSPTNRIWILGDAGRPTIEVASGMTVEINADLVGSVGFVKTGLGTLTLRGASEAFTGEITISAGSLRLAGRGMRLLDAPGVTITGAGGSLDVPGFAVTPIPAQTVYSLDDLVAGVEPTVVVSNLDEGVELVLGTDYTVAYSNNTACGWASVVVTGKGEYDGVVRKMAFVIHSVKQLTTSYNLTGDEDWSGFESVSVVSAGVILDLKGHKLTVTGLDGAGKVTDTVGGGELHFYVPASYASGYEAKIDTVSLMNKLKLVKEGPGLLICSKTNQDYTGGTDILGGVLRIAITPGNTMDNGKPLGPNTSSAHNRVYLGPNGILDPASIAGWSYHDLTIDGGMISNTVANMNLPGQARCFNPCFTVNADFTFATTEQYGLQLREFGGHTVTVSIAPNKVLYLMTGAPLPTSGRLNIVGGGTIGTLTDYPPNLSAIDFVDCNAALNLSGALSVHDYRPSCTANSGKGSAQLNVYGTFTPASVYFYGPTMQDGSIIDLSEKTGEWSLASSLTTGANNKTKFVSGAEVKINFGTRELRRGDKVIAWTSGTKPDETVVFKAKSYSLEAREDGLYVASVKRGMVIIVR